MMCLKEGHGKWSEDDTKQEKDSSDMMLEACDAISGTLLALEKGYQCQKSLIF